MGWSSEWRVTATSGEHFNIFITADQNIQYQQNLSGRRLAILVLPSNQVPIVTQLLPSVETLLAMIQPGTVVNVPLL